MSLESLPDELWLRIFKFLTIPEVIRSFCGLNSRSNRILYTHLQKHGIDFRSASKKNFEFICQNQLPSITGKITRLCLSDDDETPHQSKLFLKNGFTLNLFTSLTSLSLYELRLDETWNVLMDELSYLSELTSLKLIKCFVENVEPSSATIMNKIWSLPKLIQCHFDINFRHDMYLAPITTKSSSLKHLIIEGNICCLCELSKLFDYTQNLEHISIHSQDNDQRQILRIMRSLTTLELHIEKYEHMMMNLLQKTPNLCHLKVSSLTIHLNGQQWEQIINNHLPQLKILQFKMNYSCPEGNVRQEMDRLLESFKSRFWLEDHKWYVRCQYVRYRLLPGFTSSHIVIYTIPYAFSNLSFYPETWHISTCPNADDYGSYDSVKTLSYDRSIWENSSAHSQSRFPNVRHLDISHNITNGFWSIITNFNQLKSLKVTDGIPPSVVETLLNKTTQLYSLTLYKCILTLNNPSIRRLDLLSECHYLTSDQCHELSSSLLIIQCEVLLIKITNVTDLLPLIEKMHSLRALTIQCQNDNWAQPKSVVNDTIIEELRLHFPSTTEIGRDPKFKYYIRVWIR